MAAEDHYLHTSTQMFDTLLMDAPWEYHHFPTMPQSSSLRTVDGPFLEIIEQPKQRGFRFRYGCEGPSHGGLPGASSEKNRKTFPTVKISNYQGPCRVVVQLVTALTAQPQLHAHSLVGKHCEGGICSVDLQPKDNTISLVGKHCEGGICCVDLQPKDNTISFPNLGILHVTKKNVAKTLEERMVESFRMGYNVGVNIHPEIDAQQGEVRVPRELSDHQQGVLSRCASVQAKEMDLSVVRLMFTAFLLDNHQQSVLSSCASVQAKEMDLSVVRLMFTAFLLDSDGGFSRRLEPVVSDPIYDSKAPNASNLKIVRMDRTAGCVTGGEEVYLLCDKVQKDDIQVRFYEEEDSGVTWEALGDFSPTDVHRQFAIVFKTPPYRDPNLQKPTSVFVQLKRKSDNETSEPKPFTYHPMIIDKEEVQRKRQKTLPNFQDFSGGGSSGGSLYRGSGSGANAGGGGGPGANAGGGGYFSQGFTTYNYGGSGGGGGGATGTGSGFSTGYSAAIKHPQKNTGFHGDSADSDSDPEEDSGTEGGRERDGAQERASKLGEKTQTEAVRVEVEVEVEGDIHTDTNRQCECLFQFCVSGDAAFLLAAHRHIMVAQDDEGDTGLHLAVLHSQQTALLSVTQCVSLLPGEAVINMRNHLYQTPLHLAVLTQQCEAVAALLLAGADVTLTDRHGNTVMHMAARHGNRDILKLLLENGGRGLMEQPNTAGLCALHVAVLSNQLVSLRDIIRGGANVEQRERSYGRTALHLATEMDNVSLAGCLLLEGNAEVDPCTFNGSTPLHMAAGRGSVKLTALLMAAGADPHRENCEPVFFREDCCEEEEEEEDEGYVPGSTAFNMAANAQVLELLNGKEYKPKSEPRPILTQGDLSSLAPDVKQRLCVCLESEACWEKLAHSLGLGILNTAFRLSPSPAKTLLDSYEVSGGTVSSLQSALLSVGLSEAVRLLDCHHGNHTHTHTAAPGDHGNHTHTNRDVLDVKGDSRIDSGVCDSGVELSTA